MSTISTHVLDTAHGKPAVGVPVVLEAGTGDGRDDAGRRELGRGATDADGRLRELAKASLSEGTYRLTFDTGAYFHAQSLDAFYPIVRVVFVVRRQGEHHHVPLLLAPYGYSTYRGS
jgi:5-hydroxyisourate hydrolase